MNNIRKLVLVALVAESVKLCSAAYLFSIGGVVALSVLIIGIVASLAFVGTFYIKDFGIKIFGLIMLVAGLILLCSAAYLFSIGGVVALSVLIIDIVASLGFVGAFHELFSIIKDREKK
jgi:hypothetical protein